MFIGDAYINLTRNKIGVEETRKKIFKFNAYSECDSTIRKDKTYTFNVANFKTIIRCAWVKGIHNNKNQKLTIDLLKQGVDNN